MTKVAKNTSRSDPYKNFKFRVALVAAAVASVIGIKHITKKQEKNKA